MNCWVVAGTMLTFPGETVIETRRSCTASDAEPASEPEVAEITVVPEPALVAIPWEPDELPIMATAADEDAQVTDVVRFAVDPSVYRPVARNCSEPPIGQNPACHCQVARPRYATQDGVDDRVSAAGAGNQTTTSRRIADGGYTWNRRSPIS